MKHKVTEIKTELHKCGCCGEMVKELIFIKTYHDVDGESWSGVCHNCGLYSVEFNELSDDCGMWTMRAKTLPEAMKLFFEWRKENGLCALSCNVVHLGVNVLNWTQDNE